MRPMFVAPLVLGLVLGTGSHLEEGERALDALDYERAQTEFNQARREPNLSHASLLRLLEHHGQVAAILGHRDAAIADFRELLNLDPNHTAPEAWAPKVKTPFFEAKSWQVDHPSLQLKASTPTLASGQVTELRFELASDPLSLSRTLRVHVVGSAAPIDVPVTAPGSFGATTVPPASVAYWAELLDEHGASLIQVGDEAHLELAGAAGAPGPVASLNGSVTPDDGSVLPVVGLSIAGVGVAAGVVGAVFGLKVQSDQNELTSAQRSSNGTITSLTRAQAIQHDSQSRSDATLANVMFVAGGVAVATGVGLWVKGAFFTAAPEPGGAAVTVAMRWP